MKIAKHISAHMGSIVHGQRVLKVPKKHSDGIAYVPRRGTAYHCYVHWLARHTLKLHASKGPTRCHTARDLLGHEERRNTDKSAVKQCDFPYLRGIPLFLCVIPL